ncbi:disease resistance protein RPP8-like [Salvia hispanica]|uniref:disease resistance protein RPP8-like n=1 Tax=Salvia hispanica TaxID=49212 RepID=UPI0020090CC7|nr:disease resistance protein RPP8-like [Salvia hispanica]
MYQSERLHTLNRRLQREEAIIAKKVFEIICFRKLGAIQKLDTFLAEAPSIDTDDEPMLKEVIHELRMTMDFFRDEKPGERSRLSYLLADFAEMAQVSADFMDTNINEYFFEDEITEVLDWLRKTKKRMMEFGAGEGVSTLPQSVGGEGVVVGLEKDLQKLIGKVILKDDSGLVTSCVKGMTGVGKTTLARQVYNHVAVVEKFKHRAWVTISNNMSLHEVLVELIQQLVGLDGDSLLREEMDNRSLQRLLHQNLEAMTYFIVLDNVLQEMRMDSIFHGLPNKALDSDKSWQLFLKTIDKFTSEKNKFSKDLERKGKEMLKKCWGLPMAIIDVARQKAKQRLSGIEWEELFDSIDLSESLKKLEPMYDELDEDSQGMFLAYVLFQGKCNNERRKVGTDLDCKWTRCSIWKILG